MPYNNTPIAPSKEVSGQVSLPLARVQKIINADPERLHVSKNAAFGIALATELFIQHLATTTHNVVKAETQKKPRRNVQYRDVAAAVAKTDNLEFLVDVVPKTVRWGDVREKERKRVEEEKGRGDGKVGERGEGEGSNALERLMAGSKRVAAAQAEKEAEEGKDKDEAEAMDVDEEPQKSKAEDTPAAGAEDIDAEEDAAAMQIEMEMRGPRAKDKSPVASPKAVAKAKAAPSPAKPAAVSAASHRPTRSSGGFTAINGK
ncbi:hypothetical protein BU23DRAFT_644965 [Bimuria novae-zelandiae CBS 107.79]|uniref:Transcription factor CBF/NF-Y/archaeal histone domain-containing protein n=1 Tax=Bimuria novae-zelandiae CBS 107.79 TaxID=1447943 RepID=A0A6A5VAU8_9PLEO|nr:hypothetical protein BU23DRAFT_644965 [Bimuria novae-zelandiae CBS 107.79]